MIGGRVLERHAFPALDGMRGVAALVVLTRHVPDATLKGLFPGGYLAVDFFFALSGFVLAHAYEDRLRRGMSPRQFMALRYIRILPLYLMATGLGALLLAVSLLLGHSDISLFQWTLACGFAVLVLPLPPHAWSGGEALFPLDLPAWSLFFELAANWAFAAGLFRLRGRALAGLLVVAGVALVALGTQHGNLDGGGEWPSFGLGIARVCFSFFAGVAVFRLRRGQQLGVPIPALVPPLLLLGVLACPGSYRAVLDLAAILIFLPLLLAGSRSRHAHSLARFLGRISYGTYILQFPVIGLLDIMARRLTGAPLSAFGVGGTIGVGLILVPTAACLDLWLDMPLREKLKRRFLGQCAK